METLNIKKQIEILNGLIQANNDRIEGYKKALKKLDDYKNRDLKPLFTQMINNSLEYNEELEKLIHLYKEEANNAEGKKEARVSWMDFRAFFADSDRKIILANCEDKEDSAVRAYDNALAEDDLSDDVQKIINAQKMALQDAHAAIKALRDTL